MLRWFRGLFSEGKPALGKRDPRWPTVRRHFLDTHPFCAACGAKDNLEVHHKKPVHKFPALELFAGNLIVLCEAPGRNCHLIWGHLFNWSSWNESVDADTSHWLAKVRGRP